MGIIRPSRCGRIVRTFIVAAFALTSVAGATTTAGAADAPSAPGSGVSGYVVGGAPVGAGQFPDLAAIMLADPSLPARERLLCTGTVVAPRWILTAGHCSIGVLFGEQLVVQVGSRDLGAAAAQTVRVNRAVVHRIYFNRGVSFDVALFHTMAPVNAPVARLATNADTPLTAGGMPATAVGWGLTKQLGIEEPPSVHALPSRRARSVEIPIVDDASCAATFADLTPGHFIPASDTCAGAEGRSVCYGDSGGPLYAKDPQGALVQIGVTSRGAGCATKLFPAIFTDVRRVQGWIHRYSTQTCTNKVTIPQDPNFPEDVPPSGPLYVC
jgi:trypsin